MWVERTVISIPLYIEARGPAPARNAPFAKIRQSAYMRTLETERAGIWNESQRRRRIASAKWPAACLSTEVLEPKVGKGRFPHWLTR